MNSIIIDKKDISIKTCKDRLCEKEIQFQIHLYYALALGIQKHFIMIIHKQKT